MSKIVKTPDCIIQKQPDGSRVWAERVGRRILLLLEEDRARRLAAGLTPRTPEVLPPGPSSHEAPKG